MTEAIPYAKVDGPPDDWRGLRIFNLANGREIVDVVEVSAEGGWLIRARRNKHGELIARRDRVAKERLRGRFEIRRP